jgi:3-oxoadipate enol-lactonase
MAAVGKRIQANGLSLGYSLEGRRSGPVVVMSHGLALDRSLWDTQMAALVERFLVLRYDLRGHGTSEKSVTTLAINDQAEDAAGLLHALQLGPVHFVGLSMGGMIGQVLAFRYPEMLASLTLVDTASEVPPENKPVWEQRIQDALSHGIVDLVEPTMERWFTAAYRASNPEMVDWARGLVRSVRLDSYVAGARAIAEFDATAELPRIAVPTLVVVGDRDMTTPVRSAELLNSLIAGSRLRILSPAAHLSNVEQAEPFNEELVDFLNQHYGSR